MFSPEKKVATILMSLGEEQAAQLLAQLPQHLLKRVIRAFNGMERIDSDTVQSFIKELLVIYQNQKSQSLAPTETAKILEMASHHINDPSLKESFSANNLRTEIAETLTDINPTVTASWLVKESAATASTVLCFAPPQIGSKIFHYLKQERQVEICLTIASLNNIDDTSLETLLTELKNLQSKSFHIDGNIGGVEIVAKLIESIPSGARDILFQKLAERDKSLSSAIQKKILSIEKISTLATHDLGIVCREFPDRDLALALKPEPAPIREKFFSAMSQNRSQSLRDLLDTIGPVKRENAESAQQRLQELVTKLHANSTIFFPWEDSLV